MEKTVVLGVLLDHRNDVAVDFQKILTKHGCNIRTRLGLHHANNHKCPLGGVILLDVIGSDDDIASIENDIKSLPDTQVQKIMFEHS